MWFENKELVQQKADNTALALKLVEAGKHIDALRSLLDEAQQQLEYFKALLANKDQDNEPDEEEDTTTMHGEQIAPKPKLTIGWKSSRQRRKEYEREHSKGVTGKQLSIKTNVAALVSDPRGVVEK